MHHNYSHFYIVTPSILGNKKCDYIEGALYSVRFVLVFPSEDLFTQFTIQKILTLKNTVHQKPDVCLSNMKQYVSAIDILKKCK